MKKIFWMVFLLLFLSSCAKKEFEQRDYKVFSTKSYKEIPISKFINELSENNIVLFGETHDSPYDHYLEEDIFIRFAKNNKNIILSLEMFERDVQHYLDSYLAGEITEEEFLKNSRPWNNYPTDYRNLVEYAKKENLRVIASNIPRNLASIVSKHGEDSLNSMTDMKDYFVKPFLTPSDYKQRFFDFFSMLQSEMPMSGMGKEKTFLSQLFKDATMAYSINKELTNNPECKIFMVCGNFHSDYYQGIYQQLKAINKDVKITIISVFADSSDFDPSRADYILFK